MKKLNELKETNSAISVVLGLIVHVLYIEHTHFTIKLQIDVQLNNLICKYSRYVNYFDCLT